MLSPNEGMVLNMEHVVPATTIDPSSLATLSGFVDYTAMVANEDFTGKSALAYLDRQAHRFLQIFFCTFRNFVLSSHILCHPASLL
jgi:hypothetical protein